MEEKDNFKFEHDIESVNNNSFSGENTQAVGRSELLPVYEGMSFAGDIQPLEDLKNKEEIKVDFNNLNKGSRENNRQQNNSVRASSSRKNVIKDIAKLRKKILIALLAVILTAGVIAGGVYIYSGYDENKSAAETVFTTPQKETIVLLENGNRYVIGKDIYSIRVSDDGMYVYYTTATVSKTGKYDLYGVNIASKKSLKKRGTLIDNGVNDNWKITADGKYVCYSKVESGADTYKMYSTDSEKKADIAKSVKDIYMPSSGDVVYFTRSSGSVNSLHRVRFGENSEIVASSIGETRFFDSENGFEVLYTVSGANGSGVDLYSVTNFDSPKQICAGADEIEMESYVYSGNLYFYRKNTSNINWQDFIADNYYDTDMNMKEPAESDYMKQKGFIFKRYVLDENAYNKALREYNEKLTRDSIRAELDDLDFGTETKDEYSCYVYTNGSTVKLSSGVALDDVISCAPMGAPRIIYCKSSIKVDDKIPMDKLLELVKEKGGKTKKAAEYVRTVISDSYKLSDNCEYSWYNGNKNLSYTIEDYSADGTNFYFGMNNILYALDKGKLYKNNVTDEGLSAKILIDSDIEDCNTLNDAVYYTRTEADGNALYIYSDEIQNVKIMNNEYSHYFMNENNVLIVSRGTENEMFNIGVFNGIEYKEAAAEIKKGNFIFNKTSFAFIKDFQNSGGTLYTCKADGNPVKREDNVSFVHFVKG